MWGLPTVDPMVGMRAGLRVPQWEKSSAVRWAVKTDATTVEH